MNLMPPVILIVTGALISFGCEKREAAHPNLQPVQSAPSTVASTPPKAQVKVVADGDLFVDGQPATLHALDQRFAELAKVKGVVWYYRQAGRAEPPAVARQVIELVIKHRLPVSMSSKPDFSDTIDNKGMSHPRTGG